MSFMNFKVRAVGDWHFGAQPIGFNPASQREACNLMDIDILSKFDFGNYKEVKINPVEIVTTFKAKRIQEKAALREHIVGKRNAHHGVKDKNKKKEKNKAKPKLIFNDSNDMLANIPWFHFDNESKIKVTELPKEIKYHEPLRIVDKSVPKDDIYLIYGMIENGEIHKLQSIGSGAFGTVYKYNDYAIKVFNRSRYYSDSRYYNDGQILEDLQGNDSYLELLFYVPYHFMVTKLLEGKPFNRLTDEDKFKFAMQHTNPINVIKEFQEAIRFSWERGYEPDDVRDVNLFMTNNGKIKIMDVGQFKKHSRLSVSNVHILYESAQITNLFNIDYTRQYQ